MPHHHIHNADPWLLRPSYALYFLSCVGAYYVLPEWLLLRRAGLVRASWQPTLALLAAVALAFALFPPLANIDYAIPTMGYLDKAARLVLGDVPRMAFFAVLAGLAVLRFARRDGGLASLLVLTNAAVMLKAQVGWDKYVLLLLPALWWLAARDEEKT